MEELSPQNQWCIFCFADGDCIPAEHFIYNYVDSKFLPVCELCMNEFISEPFFVDMNLN